MIDSHTHLDVCAPPNDELVAAARAAGVTRMLTVGLDEASNRGALAAADEFPEVFAAVGRHPNNATGWDDAALDDLRELARHPKAVAVGETGLDFFRDRADPAIQREAFAAQTALARETGLPLVVHTRDAAEPTLDLLREHAGGVTVVLHCFSMPEHLDAVLAEGWWCSFAGNVTYPRNTDLADAAAQVPAERLLVETDAPFLTPQPVRKYRNQPAYVAHVAAFLAERRGVAPGELDAQLEANGRALFGW